MYKPLSGLMLVVGVILGVLGGISVSMPGKELNALAPEAATRGAAVMLLTGVMTVVALFLIDKYRPQLSYLLVLMLCSLVLTLASLATMLTGF